jgi:hypothetical protein
MYAATVQVTINKFVPACYNDGTSPSCVATLGPPQDISPVKIPGMFTQKDNCIYVTVPKGYQGSVQLVFQMPDKKYVLLGALFAGPHGGGGRTEFRDISLQRDIYGSQMAITDACRDKVFGEKYVYSILLQEVASENVGIIDPEIETDETDPPKGAKAAPKRAARR